MTNEYVRIAVKDAARPGFENVPAVQVGSAEWRLLRSPLYAMEVAAADVIRVTNEKTGDFEIVSRGGNVCVQFYLNASDADDGAKTTIVAGEILVDVEAVGGTLDAKTPGLIAFTIPAEVGFPAIEGIFAAAALRSPGSEWQYSNVYDPVSGLPLGWWD